MFENTPGAVWVARPSLRSAVASLGAVVVMTVVAWFQLPFWIQSLYTMTAGFPLWSPEVVYGLRYAVQGLLVVGLLWNLWRLFALWTVRYELTSDRFLYHHGILLRQHDEMELRRIRDFRVLQPIFSRALGLGKIHIMSRDATNPDLFIGPFLEARDIQEKIRLGVVAHQAATGYREFDSGS